MDKQNGSYEQENVLEKARPLIKETRPDRFALSLLKKGLQYAFSANSDDHKGHAVLDGLTAVYSTPLSREAIFDAYRKRHAYATSNAGILSYCSPFVCTEQLPHSHYWEGSDESPRNTAMVEFRPAQSPFFQLNFINKGFLL